VRLVRSVRDAIARAHGAVRTVAADARAEWAEQYVATLDSKRIDLLGDEASLLLVLNAGTAEETELEIVGGWYPTKERNRADPNSLYTIEVADRPELTSEVMGQADRLRMDGMLYQFTFDPPLKAPRAWTLYATELKEGGL
jgi:hypothetical protein